MESFAFIALGFLLFLSASWFARLFSGLADRSERDGVIRYGGGFPGNKVWREAEPQKFESRIDRMRSSAAFSLWFMQIVGAVFAIVGTAQLIWSAFP